MLLSLYVWNDAIGKGYTLFVFPLKLTKAHTICLLSNFQMKKSKVNYDAAMKQIDLLLPEEFIEPSKHAMTMCKDSSK